MIAAIVQQPAPVRPGERGRVRDVRRRSGAGGPGAGARGPARSRTRTGTRAGTRIPTRARDPRAGRRAGARLTAHAHQPAAPRRHRPRGRGDPRGAEDGCDGVGRGAASRRSDCCSSGSAWGPSRSSPTSSARSRTGSAWKASRSVGWSPSSSSRSRSPICCCSTRWPAPIARTSGSAGSFARCRPRRSRRPRPARRGAACSSASRRSTRPRACPPSWPRCPPRSPACGPTCWSSTTDRATARRRSPRSLGAHVVSHPVNSGQGAALQTGYLVAERLGVEVVVTLDADGQHDPSQIGRLVEPIVRDEADFVVGSRRMGESEGGGDSRARDAGITRLHAPDQPARRHRGQRHRQRLPRDPGLAAGRDRLHRGPVPQSRAVAGRGPGRPPRRRRPGHHPAPDGGCHQEGHERALRARVPAGDAQDLVAMIHDLTAATMTGR